MKKAYLYFLTFLLIFACAKENNRRKELSSLDQSQNLLHQMSKEDLKGFKWQNKPEVFSFDSSQLSISVGGKTDFFVNPEDTTRKASAPYLYREISSNFVATALVEPDLSSVWNACALMMKMDSIYWIKFGFENSDATGPSIVSVVTRMVSDDSKGVKLDDRQRVWLKMIRKGPLFALHWSRDGKKYRMARLASMPRQTSVKIGLEVQCPEGESANHNILFFSLEEKTVEDLRTGI